jgi:hypothetical protein
MGSKCQRLRQRILHLGYVQLYKAYALVVNEHPLFELMDHQGESRPNLH